MPSPALLTSLSHTTLTAPQSLKLPLLQFYNALGFQTIRYLDPLAPPTWGTGSRGRDGAITPDRNNNKLMMAGGKMNEEMMARVVLATTSGKEGMGESCFEIAFYEDTSSGSEINTATTSSEGSTKNGVGIVFYCENLQYVESKLVELKIQYTQSERALHIIDPVGTNIKLTDIVIPFSTKPPISAQILSPARLPSPPPITGRRIGVLSSGGDAPGMNAALRAIVRWTIMKKCVPYAIYEGYQGLVDGGRAIKQLQWDDVQGILGQGGTAIGTARCKQFRERSGRLRAASNLIKNGINALIIIGGDGSLTGADVLRSEWPGLVAELAANGSITDAEREQCAYLSIVGMVGSIDNDMANTDLTIGALSSLTRICDAVDCISSTASSHQRAFVVEVMGRHCGWLAMMAGIATGADFIFLPETPPNEGWEEILCQTIMRHREAGKRKNIVIVSEGATDCMLKPIRAEYIKDVISRLHIDTRVTTLGHVQRGGAPVAYDRYLATVQGIKAVDCILEFTPESPALMISIKETDIFAQPLMKAVEMTREVEIALRAKNFVRATQLRDPEFQQSYESWKSMSNAEPTKDIPDEQRMRLGIIHVGAPAGGMNSATRAAVRFAINRGHTPLAIHNGFPGLIAGDISPFSWMDVEDWNVKGGSEIGTNPDQPEKDIGLCAYQLQKHGIQALLILGGFEAYTAVLQLSKNRNQYPALCIPIVLIPATISNNVPGTHYSIGSDTALNAIVEACDRIKQSASSSRKRVFVMEIQGGRSGYLAAIGGLAGGVTRAYIPEETVSLKDLQADVALLKQRFRVCGNEGRVILRNETVSNTYTTEVMSNILKEESEGIYDSKVAMLGHLQQGGSPSPYDRVRACRMAVKCISWLETQVVASIKESIASGKNTSVSYKDMPNSGVYTNYTESAAVIGMTGANIVFTSAEDLIEEADLKRRVRKDPWWTSYSALVRTLAKYGVTEEEYSPGMSYNVEVDNKD